MSGRTGLLGSASWGAEVVFYRLITQSSDNSLLSSVVHHSMHPHMLLPNTAAAPPTVYAASRRSIPLPQLVPTATVRPLPLTTHLWSAATEPQHQQRCQALSKLRVAVGREVHSAIVPQLGLDPHLLHTGVAAILPICYASAGIGHTFGGPALVCLWAAASTMVYKLVVLASIRLQPGLRRQVCEHGNRRCCWQVFTRRCAAQAAQGWSSDKSQVRLQG